MRAQRALTPAGCFQAHARTEWEGELEKLRADWAAESDRSAAAAAAAAAAASAAAVAALEEKAAAAMAAAEEAREAAAAAQRRESALVPGHGVWPAAASGMLVSGCLSGIGASKAAPHV